MITFELQLDMKYTCIEMTLIYLNIKHLSTVAFTICQNWMPSLASTQMQCISFAKLRAASGQADSSLQGPIVWSCAPLSVQQN